MVACAERTLSASRVRVEFTRELAFPWPPEQSAARRRRGGLLRPVGKLAKAAGKAAWRRWGPEDVFGHLSGEGVIEPASRRYMIDYGSFAELCKDGSCWNGRSGRPIATLPPSSAMKQLELWWLLDVLRGTTGAVLEGKETLQGGVSCRRLAVEADLERASALVPGGLAVPRVERVGDLHALPLSVWIDGERVRCVRFHEPNPMSSSLTLELLEFEPAGEFADLDWERLPTFRSPEEAAAVRGKR